MLFRAKIATNIVFKVVRFLILGIISMYNATIELKCWSANHLRPVRKATSMYFIHSIVNSYLEISHKRLPQHAVTIAFTLI